MHGWKRLEFFLIQWILIQRQDRPCGSSNTMKMSTGLCFALAHFLSHDHDCTLFPSRSPKFLVCWHKEGFVLFTSIWNILSSDVLLSLRANIKFLKLSFLYSSSLSLGQGSWCEERPTIELQIASTGHLACLASLWSLECQLTNDS